MASSAPLPGIRGQCFSVEPNSAALAPPVDPGVYCFDEKGTLVHEPPPPVQRRFFGTPAPAAPPPAPADPPPGQTRKETEGVFVFRDGKVVFVPVKVGIAGERYFEVVSGLEPGDKVVTGPFDSVRQIGDGSAVTVR